MGAQILSAAVGIWLMAAPAVLDYPDPARANDRIAGPVGASIAIIAWWQATRLVRWANLPIGIWLVCAPWILSYENQAALINSLAAGIVFIGSSFVRGKVSEEMGGDWAVLFKSAARSEKES